MDSYKCIVCVKQIESKHVNDFGHLIIQIRFELKHTQTHTHTRTHLQENNKTRLNNLSIDFDNEGRGVVKV